MRDKNIADNNQVGGARGVGVKGVCVNGCFTPSQQL